MRFQWLLIFLLLPLLGCEEKLKPVTLDRLAPKEKLTVTLPDIPEGQPIPDRFSADGGNEFPTIKWSEPPPNTQSFLVLIEDPDAPDTKPFVHYLVFNIPPTERTLTGTLPPIAVAGRNSNGQTDYYGPRPPSGKHHYHFEVFALSTPLTLTNDAKLEAIIPKIEGFVLAGGQSVGTYKAH